MAKVLVPLAEGFEEIEAVNLINIMRRGGIEVDIAYLGGDFANDLVVGANGITIQANIDINICSSYDYDMIVLPGGSGGTNRLAQSEKVQSLLKEFKANDLWIGAICAAPLALHKAGVLNHNYTCYPSVEEQIRFDGYTKEQKVVIDGKVMTSRGPATAICFGLEIVKILVGVETYDMVKNKTLSDFC
ncbi:4-methyl-5(Beta-hydroxyethyl)-thiazole monophosphate synthesis protein [Sulfurovum sp. enrichment culture clone C5]|uniref:4-methyl-5(Beta-hydroxyethyl)-thiazole monophosphate synthesis protein n=1 Tax=Sulfurovum sp. enrichment culture clone C5 TaxID=497650 RepID=A0A0S4XNA1_9BACT|nr:4-methyl-5(Beta-hydroxyethyl)-thiazole monophosphate synthesis protein [Sulfurovum sp. enrichment culture clone C5]